MIPEAIQAANGRMGRMTTAPSGKMREDAVLAGYRECATEAMRWLSGLGYESGHPLMRSLAAHLTKRQAYLEKIDLEFFLVDRSQQGRFEEESDEDGDTDEESSFLGRLKEVSGDATVQTLLLEAVFRGCDLRYQ